MRRDARVSAIVLAGGLGTRMKATVPKVLQRVAGRPLLAFVLDAVQPLALDQTIVVVPSASQEIEAAMGAAGFRNLRYAVQHTPMGTGDAARVGLEQLDQDGGVALVLPADHPLLRASTLQGLLDLHLSSGAAATLLTARSPDSRGMGRVVRGQSGEVLKIVEEADASDEERALTEYNAGIYAFDAGKLARALGKIDRENAQGEYYLTDVIEVLRREGELVSAHVSAADDVLGVNSRLQLAEVSGIIRRRVCEGWINAGVEIIDPATTYIDASVSIHPDAVIRPFTFLEGATTIGEGAEIGPFARIVDSLVGDHAVVSMCVQAKGSAIGPGASVGPFASLRPDSTLQAGAHVGTFVETKKTVLGEDSKAPHLSYLGDAKIGNRVNIGAGTITCNWDGRDKHETRIEDDAYVSSDTMLVAPVEIGRRAATGAGAVVREDVPDDALAVGVPARIIPGKGNKMDRGAVGSEDDAAGGRRQEAPEGEGRVDGDPSSPGEAGASP